MEEMITHNIHDVHQSIVRTIEKDRATAGGLSPIQMRTLTFIHNQSGKVFQKDIEQELCIRRSTASNILQRLERDGYLIRQPLASDARLKEIILTEATLVLIDEVERYIEDLEKRMRQNISANDLAIFFDVLNHIDKNLQ